MKIVLSELEKGYANNLHLKGNFNEFPNFEENKLEGTLVVDLEYSAIGEDYHFIGKATGQLHGNCSFCQAVFPIPVSYGFKLYTHYKNSLQELEWVENMDQDSEEYQVNLAKDSRDIPLNDLLREQFILNNFLHSPDLGGVYCTKCSGSFTHGAKLAQRDKKPDPRWEKLKILLNKKQTE